MLNACKTLDDLHAGLLKKGYVLSRQALYLHLIPRKSDTTEGKRHVWTVPVKILERHKIPFEINMKMQTFVSQRNNT